VSTKFITQAQKPNQVCKPDWVRFNFFAVLHVS